MIRKRYKAALFDLDGVIVDTAKYHYLAWKELSDNLGFVFTKKHNERLKGVSRMDSLEILLEIGGITMTNEEKTHFAKEKNDRYLEYLRELKKEELLPGSEECLAKMKEMGVKIALGSASKNAPFILEKLEITHYFDVVVDGNSVSKAKPDPEVFLLGAKQLNVDAIDCIVFEDSQVGLDAANIMGALSVAIGTSETLKNADAYIPDLGEFAINNYY